MCLQLGQGWICTSASARWERRRPFLDLDSLTFGRAMAPKLYRKLALSRLVRGAARVRQASPLRLLALGCLIRGLPVRGLIGLQRLDSATHGLQRAAQMRFELLQL